MELIRSRYIGIYIGTQWPLCFSRRSRDSFGPTRWRLVGPDSIRMERDWILFNGNKIRLNLILLNEIQCCTTFDTEASLINRMIVGNILNISKIFLKNSIRLILNICKSYWYSLIPWELFWIISFCLFWNTCVDRYLYLDVNSRKLKFIVGTCYLTLVEFYLRIHISVWNIDLAPVSQNYMSREIRWYNLFRIWVHLSSVKSNRVESNFVGARIAAGFITPRVGNANSNRILSPSSTDFKEERSCSGKRNVSSTNVHVSNVRRSNSIARLKHETILTKI